MSAQPNPPREPVREREVIVTNGRDRDSSAGPLIAIIAIVLVLIVGYFIFQAIAGMDLGGAEAPAVPENINVDVNVPEGGG